MQESKSQAVVKIQGRLATYHLMLRHHGQWEGIGLVNQSSQVHALKKPGALMFSSFKASSGSMGNALGYSSEGSGSLTRAATRVFFSCSTAKHLTLSLPGLPYLTLASYQSGKYEIENMCRYFLCFIQTLKRQKASYQKLLIDTGILFSLAYQKLFTRSAIVKIQSFRPSQVGP